MKDARDESPTPPPDPISRWLHLAGPRPTVPRQLEEKTHAAVRHHWRRAMAVRARRRIGWMLAAALLVLVPLAGWLVRDGVLREPVDVPSGVPALALVEDVRGTVWLAGRVRQPLAPGDPVPPGAELLSGEDGQASLRLPSGTTLRLAAGTHLRCPGPSSLELERGAVYVATAPAAPHGGMVVRTRWGEVRDVGTQFEVRLAERALRVRVREGRIDLRRGHVAHEGRAGEELFWPAEAGLRRRPVALHGEPWAWTLAIAPRVDLEGKTLQEILFWMTRETGWTVRYDRETTRRTHAASVLHGALRGVHPEEVPQRVLPVFGLGASLEEGVLTLVEL